MTEFPLTVLVHDGPMARAYLAALFRAGLRPERIVLMIPDAHPGTGKKIGRWLPGGWRTAYAKKAQAAAMFYWPRRLRLAHRALVDAMTERVGDAFGFGSDFFDDLCGTRPLEDYAEHVERILISGLGDAALGDLLANGGPGTVLFTAGGIVPQAMLSRPSLKFLHIHPGFLPHVRGSDGLLWSMLVRGHPGASAFYMSPGIDTGDLIFASEFDAVSIPVPAHDRPDDQMLYRAVFSYFDPVLRARTLLDVLDGNLDPGDLPSQTQDLGTGVTYHYMNPDLRTLALRRVFPDDRE